MMEWEIWEGDRLIRSQCCEAPIERYRILHTPARQKVWRCTRCLEHDVWVCGMGDKRDEYTELLEIMWL